ncbi:ABC transporter ATP-binding protein [Sinimarinibacterium thermocellulolyticum]|uniref:ABC transporter ATP-binding protein n=1 Tax=Sinimarinibacterium thermocellulolyticum TaxID=3170016 RepID=A0ABV2AE10_9GAMM
MIRIKGVTKSYPLAGMARHTVIRDLTLEIPSRTHVGIIGRNGTGKTTLLRLLGGIELPDRGTVEADGSISPPLGLTSGFAQKISGRDNAKFICRISGDDPATARERVAFIRDYAELGEFFDLPVETYSSGMRARLAFSISMSFDYDYYLIDELTAVGDQKFRAKAQASFAQKRGTASVLMVSHNLDQLQRDCQVGLYLRGGQVKYYEDIGQAIADYKMDQHAQ